MNQTPVTDAEVISQQNHVEMIKRPHLWSYRQQVLPLKRWKNGKLEHAFIAREDGEGYRVRIGNLFMVAYGHEAISALPFTIYGSAEEVVAAGWEVD